DGQSRMGARMESELLQKLWSIVFRVSGDQTIPAEWLRGFAPIDFVRMLRKFGTLRISDAVEAAQTAGLCRTALMDTIDKIKGDWAGLTAAAKSDVKQ